MRPVKNGLKAIAHRDSYCYSVGEEIDGKAVILIMFTPSVAFGASDLSYNSPMLWTCRCMCIYIC